MANGRRLWTVTCVALVAAMLSPRFGIAAAVHDCRVPRIHGWQTGAGTATITMRNTGKPCGAELYTIPQQKIAVDKIAVISAPKSGVVVVTVPRFEYTPNTGFTGDDLFELSAEGPAGPKAGRITLRGTVFVRVEP